MRVLKLRFKNLNSLAGEWEIDFTHPAFSAEGIFAIAGPTGAGKTTILDALCLALYGRTPRLNKITKSGNEIMSRRTGECFAEAAFETPGGRYRCHWAQHRARKRPDGELQAQRHEIADADSGAVLESNIRGVAGRIEAVTGMDFERFTRSMMLAQGGFAAFLQADADERSPILEQITGTEIYSRISVRVHERRREEDERLRLLVSETAGIEVLDAEEEAEIAAGLEARRVEEEEVSGCAADTRKAVELLVLIEGLNREIGDLADESGRLDREVEDFAPQREGLRAAVSAASLEGRYAALGALRSQQYEDGEALRGRKAALPDLEAAAAAADECLRAAEGGVGAAGAHLESAAPAIRAVRIMDERLKDKRKAVAEEEEACRADAARIDEQRKAAHREGDKHAAAAESLRGIEAYLNAHSDDERLVGELEGVKEQLAGLVGREEELAHIAGEHAEAADAAGRAGECLDEARRQLVMRRGEREEAADRLERGRGELAALLGGRLLREYRARKEELLREQVYRARIAELEEHRRHLEAGRACPLCGALEHPFVDGPELPGPAGLPGLPTDAADEIETEIASLTALISRAEDREAALREIEAAETQARTNLANAEAAEAGAARMRGAAEDSLARVTGNLNRRRAELDEHRRAAAEKLSPLGLADSLRGDIPKLIGDLEARRETWRQQISRKEQTDKQIAELAGELKRIHAVIETQTSALEERSARLESVKSELADSIEKRRSLYGEKNPEEEEERLKAAIARAEAAERQAGEKRDAQLQACLTARDRIAALEAGIARREPEQQTLEDNFAAALTSAGFEDEQMFLKACLPNEQRAALEARARALDERRTELNTKQADRRARLEAEQAKRRGEESMEELRSRLDQYEKSLKELREITAALQHKLRENAAAGQRLKEKQSAIENQKKEWEKWDKLHTLIGSADGRKFRNFAQGITFEMMVDHANISLGKMTDRYLLIRDKDEPLLLNVLDNYQAGEVRSTQNLSGGESFIVSLALALGLSRMAGRNVRVDSLFLDEGFGTLDEEALDTALETLGGLQQNGKLIGVISHVAALKERIGTQIQVTPLSGGRSRITGPGCGPAA